MCEMLGTLLSLHLEDATCKHDMLPAKSLSFDFIAQNQQIIHLPLESIQHMTNPVRIITVILTDDFKLTDVYLIIRKLKED